jgi:D-glycero-alpha-D-manno-heptose-7-phosphate kinase
VVIHPDRRKQLDGNLMLFYTGIQRFSSQIQASTFADPKAKTAQLQEMLSLVDEAERVLTDKHRDLDDFGRLLHTTWQLKKGIGAKVSTSGIDEVYATACKAGALGGKLLGAGGGGFLLFYVPKERQAAVSAALDCLMEVPFAFEEEGATIVHYRPIAYIPRKEITLR